MSKRTDIRLGLAAALSTVLSVLTVASADPVVGERLADKWCSQCHGIRAE